VGEGDSDQHSWNDDGERRRDSDIGGGSDQQADTEAKCADDRDTNPVKRADVVVSHWSTLNDGKSHKNVERRTPRPYTHRSEATFRDPTFVLLAHLGLQRAQ
jgi:hypothetical protein